MVLPDQAQRNRALTDHGSTLLVEAGAGSGKTSLMAGRVVLMLAEGFKPRELAAITFTELAAGELFTRICEYLDEILVGGVPVGLDQVLVEGLSEDQLSNLEAARLAIGELTATTIHGFCQQLIRPYPVEAGLDPGARVMDKADATLAWEELLASYLRECLNLDDGESDLAAFVLAAGDKAEYMIGKLAEFLREHRTARPANVVYDPDLLQAFLAAIDAFIHWVNAQNVHEPTTDDLVNELGDFSAAYRTALSGNVATDTLMRLALEPITCSAHTQKLTWRRWGRKGKWEKVASAVGVSKAEGGQLSGEADGLYSAIGAAWTALQSTIGASAFTLLVSEFDELPRRYAEYKRKAALLDFSDLLLQARDLLRNDEAVRQALANRYRQVLVDEFQDTDPIQAEILWRLCGEGAPDFPWQARELRAGSLFCVGDPKQAIYRFRGADVDTYVTARDAIRHQYPDNILEITANFRSLSPILAYVNERFSGPLQADGQPGFEALSATKEPSTEAPKVVSLPVDVVAVGDKPKEDEIRESEAAAVAILCRHLVGSDALEGRRDEPQVRPGDIALLAPVGTELWRYERALENLAIPVATQAGKGFFRRQEIQDLIAITRAIADSRDSVALGALLRGPLVGLTEEELLDVIARLPAGNDPQRIPRLRLWTELDQVQHELARHMLAVLQGLARQSHSTTPFQLLSTAVEELRVRPILTHRHPGGAERALANIDLFLEMARPYEIRGLKAFSMAMRQKWEDAESQVEGRPDAEEQAVHLITMHSAKGLEWPIVIPVNSARGPRSVSGLLHQRDRDEIFYQLGSLKHPGYEAVLSEEQGQQEREQIRLLYVACTRAEELLILPKLSAGQSLWLNQVNLDIDGLPEIDLTVMADDLPDRPSELRNVQDSEIFSTEAATIAAAASEIEWRRPSRHEGENVAVRSDHGDATVFVDPDEVRSVISGGPARGSLIHKLLEEVLTSELGDNGEELTARATVLIQQVGETVADDPADGLCPAELAESVLRVLGLPEVAELRGRLEPELPVYSYESGCENGSDLAISGIVDAIAYTSGGEAETVIDWKTDVDPGQEQRLSYKKQMIDYLKVTVAQRGLIVYTTLGLIDEVVAG